MLLAMDKKTVRTVSKDGHLHVAVSHISKANVCPYRGSEIPNGQDLGLDPDHVYKLLRHPDELAKAAATFNNLPVLTRHVPVTSAAFPKELVVGSTGTDAKWNAPYLDNSLVIWTDEAIAGVESDKQREISSCYHYVAEMTPGEYGGLRYDGIMRNIIGNHVALVPEGRAGSDILVGDSKLDLKIMAKGLKSRKAILLSGAFAAYARTKLAQDAKPLDLAPVLNGVTAANYKAKKTRIGSALEGALKTAGLAQDATLEDIVELVDALEDVTDGEVDEDAIVEAAEAGPADTEEDDTAAVDADGDKLGKLLAWLKDKLSDEDFAAATEMAGAATNDPAAEGETAQDGGGKPMKTGMDAKMVDKMIKTATDKVRSQMVAAAQARKDVAPFVGEVSLAMDSAPDIYKFALDNAKVDTKGVDPSAYGAMVKMLPVPGARREPMLAQDSADSSDFAANFPGARAPKRI